MAKIKNYVRDSYYELLHKVTWPTWSELQSTTVIVIVSLIIITLIILGMDQASEFVMKLIYGV